MPEDQNVTRIEQVVALEKTLSRLTTVTRLDTPDHRESDALAHAINDLDDSFLTLSQTLFPRLKSEGLDSKAVQDILWDIREELRHVVYHIRDCGTFKDILDE